MRIIGATACVFSVSLALCGVATAGALQEAVERRDLDLMQRLLMGGHPVDGAPDGDPLYFAAFRGFDAGVAFLLDHGADPNRISPWGAPLHGAARKGQGGAVALLLEAGADPDIVESSEGYTPLHTAALSGRIAVMAQLLDAGASINARTDRGEPAIHLAAMKKRRTAVAFLKERGFQPKPVSLISPALAGADIALGRELAEECLGCHTFEPGKHGPQAPSLWGVVGRDVASAAGFDYSASLLAVDGQWGYEALNQYLADVTGTVPGVKMYAGGQNDAADRAAIIVFLRSLSETPLPLP